MDSSLGIALTAAAAVALVVTVMLFGDTPTETPDPVNDGAKPVVGVEPMNLPENPFVQPPIPEPAPDPTEAPPPEEPEPTSEEDPAPAPDDPDPTPPPPVVPEDEVSPPDTEADPPTPTPTPREESGPFEDVVEDPPPPEDTETVPRPRFTLTASEEWFGQGTITITGPENARRTYRWREGSAPVDAEGTPLRWSAGETLSVSSALTFPLSEATCTLAPRGTLTLDAHGDRPGLTVTAGVLLVESPPTGRALPLAIGETVVQPGVDRERSPAWSVLLALDGTTASVQVIAGVATVRLRDDRDPPVNLRAGQRLWQSEGQVLLEELDAPELPAELGQARADRFVETLMRELTARSFRLTAAEAAAMVPALVDASRDGYRLRSLIPPVVEAWSQGWERAHLQELSEFIAGDVRQGAEPVRLAQYLGMMLQWGGDPEHILQRLRHRGHGPPPPFGDRDRDHDHGNGFGPPPRRDDGDGDRPPRRDPQRNPFGDGPPGGPGQGPGPGMPGGNGAPNAPRRVPE